MTDIIEVIRSDHDNLNKLLSAVEQELDKFDRGELPDYDIIEGAADYCLNYPDVYHHPVEDLLLQRLHLRDPDAAAAVGDLEAQHQGLGEMARRFKESVETVLREHEVSREDFVQHAREFVAGYRMHMRKEEEVFLPAAEKALSAQDRAEVSAQAGPREDPLGEGGERAQYEELCQKLLRWAGETT